MIIIDKGKHPNLFEALSQELSPCGYISGNWGKIEILETIPHLSYSQLKDNIAPKWFHAGIVKECKIYHVWLENLLNQNETLLIEFTKARLGH